MTTQLFHLTKAQRDKLERGEGFQFSHRQLHSPNEKERHGVEMEMTDEGLKKMSYAISHGKGFRLHQGHYKGFGFLDTVKDFAKKHAGKTAETIKKVIPKDTVHLAIQNGLTAAGMSPDTASLLAASGTAAIYSTDFSKPIGDQSGKILSSSVNSGVKQYKKNKDASKLIAQQAPVEVGGSFLGLKGFKGENDYHKSGLGFITKGLPLPHGAGFYKDVSKVVKCNKPSSVGSNFSSELHMTPIQIKMAALRAMKKSKSGGSFQGGDIKSTPTYLANHNGMNSKEVNKIKWDQSHMGGSFKGGSTLFHQQGNPIVDSDKVRRALEQYSGGNLVHY